MVRQTFSTAYGIRVLFMDIVGYTRFSTRRQVSSVKLLTKAVHRGLQRLGIKTMTDTEDKGYFLSSTGDGYVLSLYSQQFESGQLLSVACDIQRYLRRRSAIFSLRYGLNLGPGVLVKVNSGQIQNVLGGCINRAQRIMSLGDENHILLSESYFDVVDWLKEERGEEKRIREINDVRIDKHGASRATIFNYVEKDLDVGNESTPYRALMGNLNIEHATECVLDILAERFENLIVGFMRKKRRRGRLPDPRIRVTILNYNPRDKQVWVTPHSRCNGKTVKVNEHIFEIEEEGCFSEVVQSTLGDPRIRWVLGLPDYKKDREGYIRALRRLGKFKKKTILGFSGRARAFIYYPIIHQNSVIGILSVDSTSPICDNEEEFREVGDVLRQSVDFGLMRVLGHCYQD